MAIMFTDIVGYTALIQQDEAKASVVLYVGFALMFRSALAIGFSFALRRLRMPGWGFMLFIGILGIKEKTAR